MITYIGSGGASNPTCPLCGNDVEVFGVGCTNTKCTNRYNIENPTQSMDSKNIEKIESELRDKLNRLDKHINSLGKWDDYAEDCQREYDWLLKEYNELKEKQQ